MAAPTIGRPPRYLLSAATPRVDWSHPFAAGLDSYVICRNNALADMVSGSPPDSQAGAGTATALSTGQAVNLSSNGAFWSLTSKPAFPLPLSAFVVAVNPAATFKVFVSYTGSGSTGKGWKFGSSASATRLGFTLGGVADYQFAVGSLPSTASEITAGVTVAGTTATGYVNGASVGTATVGTLSDATHRGLGIGASVSNTNVIQESLSQPIGLVAVWKRALSAAAMAQLHADPFCLLRY